MLLSMSVSAAVFIFAVLVLRALFLGKLPNFTFQILWGIALARLLLPFSFSSPFSIWGTLGEKISDNFPRVITLTSDGFGKAALFTNENNAKMLLHLPQLILWAAGGIFVAVFLISAHLKARKTYKMSVPFSSEANAFLQSRRIVRKIEIRQSDLVLMPITYGISRPIILLPKCIKEQSNEELQIVLLHEFMHIKHFDVLKKWLLVLAVSVHWFNPFAWLLFFFASRDIELYCDERALKILGKESKEIYANTLISVAERAALYSPLVNAFSSNSTKERIVSVMNYKKTTLLGAIIAAAIIIGATSVFASSAASSDAVTNGASRTLYNVNLSENKSAAMHEIDVNGKAVYKLGENAQQAFSADKTYNFCLDIKDRKFPYGQGLAMGYIYNGKATELFCGQVKNKTQVSFLPPENGEYLFYIECASSDSLRVESVKVKDA